MHRWLLVIGFSWLLASCTKNDIQPSAQIPVSVDSPSLSHPLYAPLDSLAQLYVKKGLPGIAICVSNAQGVCQLSAGWADLEHKRPLSLEHSVKTGSITKLFMGGMTMWLLNEQAQGRLKSTLPLDLQKPLSHYLPAEWIQGIDNAENCSVRALMNHQSGIYNLTSNAQFYLDVTNDPFKKRGALELLKYVRGQKAYFDNPGDGIAYSNTNTLLLSLVLDRVLQDATWSGAGPFIEVPTHGDFMGLFMAEAGLVGSAYYPHQDLPEKLAQGYFDIYNNHTYTNLTHWITGDGNGYNGLYATAPDLNRFIRKLMGAELFEQRWLDTMMNWAPGEEYSSKRGLGINLDFGQWPTGLQAIGHGGRDLAACADAYYLPQSGAYLTFVVNYGGDGNSWVKPVFQEFERALIELVAKS
ncbi:MAG: serine hydrolase domain-containing protein [Bacteroidia bacterium]